MHVSRTVSARLGDAVHNLDARANGAKDLCPLTKNACSIVPGAGEDVHIYIRCATRIFRRGGSHSEALYNLGLILEIMS